ncbi:ABC transporter permease [Frondihabitans sucicola]|uniref:ABC transporter permease n=1 Tax=Frondihabitans sucicola TaxID=1268041 RepID=A0ABM8GTR0_9MICO|nr:sugar ABC transporter permease [Frondihabitans sucicola]BDZ51852.1 ABC transporter permease [Frondihabitans sucicola]
MTQSVVAPARVRPTSVKPPKKRNANQRRQNRAAYIFVAPFLLVFVLMLLVPLFYSGYLSLFATRLVGGSQFAGLTNYIRAFTDPAFLSGVGRMGLFLIIQVPIMLALALFFALAIDSGRVKGAGAIRLLIFIPYAVPGVVATLMWGYIYGNDFGPISQVFRAIGFAPPDLLSAGTILGSIMNIVTWEFIGYNMIIMYAALRSIPTELYEAAEIDGAGQFRIAWSIKIPAIRPAIMLTVIFSIIGTFQTFNEPSLLHGLAPNVIDNAYTPNYYAYNLAFTNQDVNYAAAIAFLLGIVIAVVSYVVQLSTQRRETKNS